MNKIKSILFTFYIYLMFNINIIKDYLYYSFINCDKSYNKSSNIFKFITFNLRREVINDADNRWHFRKDKIIDFFKTEQPSIICSQEVMPHMFKFVNNKIGNIYDHYSVDNYLGCRLNHSINPWSEGNIILYDKTKYKLINKGKFWLSDTPNKPSSSWGNKCLRTCIYVGLQDESSKIIYVFNTHFDHITAEARKKSSILVLNKIKEIAGENDIYLCGDFNATINSKELSQFNIFDNSYNHNKSKTFNCFNKSKTKTLDAIYYNYGKLFDIIVPDINISDHTPVILSEKNGEA